jgi:uncharacterized protein (TIGR00725 family)
MSDPAEAPGGSPVTRDARGRQSDGERRVRQVSVIGVGDCAQDSEVAQLAEEVGRRLAEAGVKVVCGGLGGAMEAAARGASEAGGTVIGIVPGASVEDANPHCTHVVASAVGYARNLAVVASGDAVIAVGGQWGTLSEIGHARTLGKTVVALRSWDLSGRAKVEGAPGVIPVDDAEQAVATALEAIESRPP